MCSVLLKKGGGNTLYDELIMLISNLGFPAAVSIYLLVRVEKKLDDLTEAFSEFTKVLITMLRTKRSEELIKR